MIFDPNNPEFLDKIQTDGYTMGASMIMEGMKACKDNKEKAILISQLTHAAIYILASRTFNENVNADPLHRYDARRTKEWVSIFSNNIETLTHEMEVDRDKGIPL